MDDADFRLAALERRLFGAGAAPEAAAAPLAERVDALQRALDAAEAKVEGWAVVRDAERLLAAAEGGSSAAKRQAVLAERPNLLALADSLAAIERLRAVVDSDALLGVPAMLERLAALEPAGARLREDVGGLAASTDRLLEAYSGSMNAISAAFVELAAAREGGGP